MTYAFAVEASIVPYSFEVIAPWVLWISAFLTNY
jgi:hypothetical protein